MKLEVVTRKGVSHVELEKDEKHCLGITITDKAKEEAGPVVKKVKSKSPAEKSFAISPGDVIISLNGYSTVGARTKEIIGMIKETGKNVALKLQYATQEIRFSLPCVYSKKQLKIELRKVGKDFEFILRKQEQSINEEYPTISNIKEGSQLHRSNIYEGDHLVKLDGVDLSFLSLAEIARMLQEKNKAEFTFEYDVRVGNLEENEEKLYVEIDAPITDLGLRLSSGLEESGSMYVESIKVGSIAERCGAFSEGDAVLSINEIDVKLLSVSKANILLQNGKKCRKICLFTKKRNETKNIKYISENSGSEIKSRSTRNSTGNQVYLDWKPMNMSESSDYTFPFKQRSYFQKVCFSEQMSAISNMQSIVKVLRSLTQNLFQMIRVVNEKKLPCVNENCLLCSKFRPCVKLCVSCLTKLNGSSTQSLDILQKIVARFVALLWRNSVNLQLPVKVAENGISGNDKLIVSVRTIVYALKETLPKLFSSDHRLQEEFNVLAEKIACADISCVVCDYEVKYVWVIVQKLLLLLSLEDNGHENKALINELIGCLLGMEFSCYSKSDCSSLTTESLSDSSLLLFCNENTSSGNYSRVVQDNVDLEMNSTEDSNDIIFNIPELKVKTQTDYLKLAHVQSFSASESLSIENKPRGAITDRVSLYDDDSASVEVNIPSSESPSIEDEVSNNDGKFYEDQKLSVTPSKICRSLDPLLTQNKYIIGQTEITKKFFLFSNKRKANDQNVGETRNTPAKSSSHPLNNLLPNHKPTSNGDKASDSNGESNRSSKSLHNSKIHPASSKTHTDTVVVKMTNHGEGFGIGIGMKFSSVHSSVVPVVSAIKPKSPSHMSGVLKMDDRIVAINGESTLGLTRKQIHGLKNRAFSADSLTLTAEFDVPDAEFGTGTFDVVLDKTLKIGLLFEDMRRGFPMIVAGIVKGSGAHRCGQLFPGDKIKFFRCIRNEEFDPVSCNYSKEESVLITVQRDPCEGTEEKPASPPPSYFNPCFSHRDTETREGTMFVVRSTAMHAVEGTDILVLDQEVTLYRDPVYCDFGFLIGENPQTGRAYVTGVRPEGPADESGVIKKLDRIVEVNGISVDKNVENSVLTLLSQANHKVDLLVRRFYHENSDGL